MLASCLKIPKKLHILSTQSCFTSESLVEGLSGSQIMTECHPMQDFFQKYFIMHQNVENNYHKCCEVTNKLFAITNKLSILKFKIL